MTKFKLHKSALQCLLDARELIRPIKHWTQNYLAVDCDGNNCRRIRSNKAVAFCALGAVKHIDGPGERKATTLLAYAAHDLLGLDRSRDVSRIFEVNDDSDTQQARRNVLKIFRQAIKEARETARG